MQLMSQLQSKSSVLPTRLGKEPLVDVVFEIRFESASPASNIFPGILFSKLSGQKQVERLPAADLPHALRSVDPNIKFAPVGRIVWGDYLILFSDSSVAIACKLPYPGWNKFKSTIEQIMEFLLDTDVIQRVVQLDLKYVDLLEISTLREQIKAVNLTVGLAEHKLENENFQLRIELKRNNLTNVVQIASGVTVGLTSGIQKTGLMIDVDTVKLNLDLSAHDFRSDLSNTLQTMHSTNKAVFFSILTPHTTSYLEPSYDEQ
jgi:uncharacterized protein (TIGR04255 family)